MNLAIILKEQSLVIELEKLRISYISRTKMRASLFI